MAICNFDWLNTFLPPFVHGYVNCARSRREIELAIHNFKNTEAYKTESICVGQHFFVLFCFKLQSYKWSYSLPEFPTTNWAQHCLTWVIFTRTGISKPVPLVSNTSFCYDAHQNYIFMKGRRWDGVNRPKGEDSRQTETPILPTNKICNC